jgi:hypothetical protein
VASVRRCIASLNTRVRKLSATNEIENPSAVNLLKEFANLIYTVLPTKFSPEDRQIMPAALAKIRVPLPNFH